MKIYRVPSRGQEPHDEHSGYSYHLSKREAHNDFKTSGAIPERGDKIEELELRMDKWSMIDFLNKHCSYPDNG